MKRTIIGMTIGLIIGCTPVGNTKVIRIIVAAITGA